MRLNQTLIIIITFILPVILFSQSKPMKWGTIPKEDLLMETYDRDTTAAAIVLGDFAIMQVADYVDSYRTSFIRHRRIKILKEAGLEYGDVEIPYYSHEKTVGMGKVSAQIINPDGTKTTLGKKEIFEEKYNEYWSVAKFAFPNLQVGSVIEWKYETLSKRVSLLPTWFFHEEIPIRHNELWVYFPQNFSYTYLFEGSIGMTQRKEDDVTILESDAGNMRVTNQKFIMSHGVAMKEEPYITTMDDYRARITFQLDSYLNGQGVLEEFLSSWEEVAKELDHNPYFGVQYNRKKFTKKLVETLEPDWAALQTEQEKAMFIYEYLANNFVWDGSFGMTVDQNLDKVIEEKQGSSGDLNLLQLALLKAAGIKASPMLVSTRSNGKMYEKFPMLRQFNHVLVYATLDGKEVVIDVPNKNRAMNLPMSSSLQGRGVVIHPTSATWINIKSQNGADIFAYNLKLDEEGTLSGNLQCAFKGYNAMPERRAYKKDETGKHWKERFSENYPEVQIDSVLFENLDASGKTFKDELKIVIPEAAQVVGDFIYFNPVLYSNFSENIFKLEKRHFPVDFAYPMSERLFINVKIPDGYVIEELPENANFILGNKGGSFLFAIEEKKKGILQIVVNLKIKQLRFAPQEYPNVKELFSLVEEKLGEQIVLKKRE